MRFWPYRGLLLILCLSGLAPPGIASSWTTGAKKLLYIRVDFADYPGDPISVEQAETEMKKVVEFYRDNSYGKLQLSGMVTRTVRMPHTYTEYEKMSGSMIRIITGDARQAARDAGYKPDEFDLDVVFYRKAPHRSVTGAFINIVIGWALHHQRGLLLTNPDGRTIAHELGHNLNLTHSHGAAWQTKDGSIIGPGQRVERGNPFDRMGNGYFWEAHFTSRAKHYLGWIEDSGILRVAKSGTYTIQAHDTPTASGARALEIALPQGGEKKYWIEFRQRITNNDDVSYGALLHWSYPDGATELLDMNPGSSRGMEDAPLTIGRTFSDAQANIHITPLRRHDGDPATTATVDTPATLDVHVEIGPSGNHPPKFELRTTGNKFRLRQPVSMAAIASDPDGDELSYYWEFSDGKFSLDSPSTVERSFDRSGTYSVRCQVSDRKGGVAEQTFRFDVVR